MTQLTSQISQGIPPYLFLALRNSLLKHACYECDKRFKTQTQLQVHLAEHDNEDMEDETEIMPEGDPIDPNVRIEQQNRDAKRSASAAKYVVVLILT